MFSGGLKLSLKSARTTPSYRVASGERHDAKPPLPQHGVIECGASYGILSGA